MNLNRYINLGFNNLKECQFESYDYSKKYINFNNSNKITFDSLPKNSIQYINGLNISTAMQNVVPYTNTIVLYPGRLEISKVGENKSKLHYLHQQTVIEYNSSTQLNDGGSMITVAGVLYIYAIYNDISIDIQIGFSNIEPNRDKYGNDIIHHSETTMYHPTLNARCIGTLFIGRIFSAQTDKNTNSYLDDGILWNSYISENSMTFTKSSYIYGGTSSSYYDTINYQNENVSTGVFPVTCNGAEITVTGAGIILEGDAIKTVNKIDNIVYPDTIDRYKRTMTAYKCSIHGEQLFIKSKTVKFKRHSGYSYEGYSAWFFLNKLFISR